MLGTVYERVPPSAFLFPQLVFAGQKGKRRPLGSPAQVLVLLAVLTLPGRAGGKEGGKGGREGGRDEREGGRDEREGEREGGQGGREGGKEEREGGRKEREGRGEEGSGGKGREAEGRREVNHLQLAIEPRNHYNSQ